MTPDLILGYVFLSAVGLSLDPSSKTIKWFYCTTPWKQYSDYLGLNFTLYKQCLPQEETEDVLETTIIHHNGPVGIQESRYGKVDPANVAAQQKHLSPQQQQKLAAIS